MQSFLRGTTGYQEQLKLDLPALHHQLVDDALSCSRMKQWARDARPTVREWRTTKPGVYCELHWLTRDETSHICVPLVILRGVYFRASTNDFRSFRRNSTKFQISLGRIANVISKWHTKIFNFEGFSST